MNSLSIYKIVNIKSYDFTIYKDNDGKLLFDLVSFSTIHHYSKPRYLINYYGRGNKPINIFYNLYTDWDGIVQLCSRARKIGVYSSFLKLAEELDKMCGICYERLGNTMLNCKHIFCGTCINILYKSTRNFTCPYCRVRIVRVTSL
jgi:hypothetical protein